MPTLGKSGADSAVRHPEEHGPRLTQRRQGFQKRTDGVRRKHGDLRFVEELRPYVDEFRTALVELAAAA